MKKYTLLFLCAVMIFTSLSLFSCGKTPENVPEPVENSTDDESPLRLVDHGKPRYEIVLSKYVGLRDRETANRLNGLVKNATGVELPVRKITETPNEGLLPLYLGDTDAEEAKVVTESLDVTMWAFTACGTGLCLCAYSDDLLASAVDYLESHLAAWTVTHADGTKSLCFDPFTSPDPGPFRIGGYTLFTELTVVYETARKDFDIYAEKLADEWEKAFGIRPQVLPDTADTVPASGRLLLGHTKFSDKFYKTYPKNVLEYAFCVDGKDAQILCGGLASAEAAVTDLPAVLHQESVRSYGDGIYFRTSLVKKTTPRAAGSDVRVMTSNILVDEWVEDCLRDAEKNDPNFVLPIGKRSELFAGLLVAFQPDAVGVQEVCYKWTAEIAYWLPVLKADYGVEYTHLFAGFPADEKTNMTGLLYRSDLFTLDASEVFDYSYWPSGYTYHIRDVAWMKLTKKTDASVKFILANTHWPVVGSNPTWMTPTVEEETAFVKKMRADHPDIPLFLTGDFNQRPGETYYESFVASSGVTDLTVAAREASVLLNDDSGWGKLGDPHHSVTYCDHIFAAGKNVTVKLYETLNVNGTEWLSDHSSMIADVKITK